MKIINKISGIIKKVTSKPENIQITTTNPIIEPEDEDDDFDDLLGEFDEWEDDAALERLKEKMPAGWYMVKVTNYTAGKLKDIDEWCELNCCGEYKRVGFTSGCAYMVAVQFEESRDAVLYKLTF
ncbi:unnamed protein product [Sphagnum tenellum]